MSWGVRRAVLSCAGQRDEETRTAEPGHTLPSLSLSCCVYQHTPTCQQTTKVTTDLPDVVQCSSAPPSSSAVTTAPVAARTRGGPPKKIVPLPLTITLSSTDVLFVCFVMCAMCCVCHVMCGSRVWPCDRARSRGHQVGRLYTHERRNTERTQHRERDTQREHNQPAIAGTYAPPAVHDPSTTAIWGMPCADMRACFWLFFGVALLLIVASVGDALRGVWPPTPTTNT